MAIFFSQNKNTAKSRRNLCKPIPLSHSTLNSPLTRVVEYFRELTEGRRIR
jgi:hypothetical protein